MKRLDWSNFETWLKKRTPHHARNMFLYAQKYHDFAFNNSLVEFPIGRKKDDIVKSLSLLSRYLDILHDTYLHEEYKAWLKRKEIRWNSVKRTAAHIYAQSKALKLENVIPTLKRIDSKYRLFALFCLVSGLRPEEAMRAYVGHEDLCVDSVMELFWDRGNKKANAVFCHPTLHKALSKKDISISRRLYQTLNKKNLGFELRDLRKINFTMNAKIDPLLADFMQGRLGNIAMKHYYLPQMKENYQKWLDAWTPIIEDILQTGTNQTLL